MSGLQTFPGKKSCIFFFQKVEKNKQNSLKSIETLFAELASMTWSLWGPKSRFHHFFKVVLEMFRKSLGIVFGIKMHTFGALLSSRGPIHVCSVNIRGKK